MIFLLRPCRSKLEQCMSQWQDYDGLYDNLSKWVKDTEVKVRNESGLKPDLPAKEAQLEAFKVRRHKNLGAIWILMV